MTVCFDEVIDDPDVVSPLYGVPSYGDPPFEPSLADVPVFGQIFDREGWPWFRHEDGWVCLGDSRPQSWFEVARWFGV